MLVRQFLDQTELPWHYSSADGMATSDAVWISQQWEAARIKYRSKKQHSAILVIDEVQNVDNWSEQVKKEWDRDRTVHSICVGAERK